MAFISSENFIADLKKIVVIVLLMAAYKWEQVFSCWGFVLPQVCQQRCRVSALGLEVVSTRDLGKGGGQKEAACWALWVTAQDDMSNKQSLHSRQGVCPRGHSGWGSIHPEDLTHTCPSPCPLYPLHPYLLTSVSNYSPLSLAQSLSSESLWKGRGNGCRRNKATNTRSIKIQGKSEKGKCRQDFTL